MPHLSQPPPSKSLTPNSLQCALFLFTSACRVVHTSSLVVMPSRQKDIPNSHELDVEVLQPCKSQMKSASQIPTLLHYTGSHSNIASLCTRIGGRDLLWYSNIPHESLLCDFIDTCCFDTINIPGSIFPFIDPGLGRTTQCQEHLEDHTSLNLE